MVYREAMRIYEVEKDTMAKNVDPKSNYHHNPVA